MPVKDPDPQPALARGDHLIEFGLDLSARRGHVEVRNYSVRLAYALCRCWAVDLIPVEVAAARCERAEYGERHRRPERTRHDGMERSHHANLPSGRRS